jgi:DNA-directed RNA polymerase subunit L
LIQVCGYKKPHPLTELIIFNVMIKPDNYTELQKKSYITKTFIDTCKDLIDLLDIMKKGFKL